MIYHNIAPAGVTDNKQQSTNKIQTSWSIKSN